MKKFMVGVSQYLSDDLIIGTIKILKFLIIYTIAFVLLILGIKYAIPFVIAYFIALTLRPIKRRILSVNNKLKKFKISNSLVSMALTLCIVGLIFLVIALVGYQIVGQLKNFYDYITNQETINSIYEFVSEKAQVILKNKQNIDPELMTKINEAITNLVSGITSLIAVIIQNMMNIIISLPTAFIMVIITIIATYFFTKDIEIIQVKIKSAFSEKGIKLLRRIRKKKNDIFSCYIKAYSLIMLCVCVYSIILFEIIGLKYAIAIGIITALLDALPIIGAGLVYGILAIISISSGDIKVIIILIIGYIGSIVFRQFIEQKLVASFLGVHPLVIIISLFIVLTPLGFAGMFYFLGAFLLYDAIS